MATITLSPGRLFCDGPFDKPSEKKSKLYNFAKWTASVMEGEHWCILTQKISEVFFSCIFFLTTMSSKDSANIHNYYRHCRVEYALLDALSIKSWHEIYGRSQQTPIPIELKIDPNNNTPTISLRLNKIATRVPNLGTEKVLMKLTCNTAQEWEIKIARRQLLTDDRAQDYERIKAVRREVSTQDDAISEPFLKQILGPNNLLDPQLTKMLKTFSTHDAYTSGVFTWYLANDLQSKVMFRNQEDNEFPHDLN